MTIASASAGHLCSAANTKSAVSSVVLPALFAIFLGLATIGIVGFAQIDVVHNAAHNTRHVNAFPCH